MECDGADRRLWKYPLSYLSKPGQLVVPRTTSVPIPKISWQSIHKFWVIVLMSGEIVSRPRLWVVLWYRYDCVKVVHRACNQNVVGSTSNLFSFCSNCGQASYSHIHIYAIYLFAVYDDVNVRFVFKVWFPAVADLPVDSVQSMYDASELHKVVSGARSARCRQRFAVPVILFEGKVHTVCRLYWWQRACVKEQCPFYKKSAGGWSMCETRPLVESLFWISFCALALVGVVIGRASGP